MRYFKLLSCTIIFAFISFPVLAQNKSGGKTGKIPQGWNVRFDHSSANMSDVKFTDKNNVLHFNADASGAAIYYKTNMTASGSYSVQGKFNQLERTKHPEAYGLFIGGNNLQKDNQHYLYFLIRQDGKFLIKNRKGSDTESIVGWTASDAVKAMKTSQPTTNTLKIKRGENAVTFLVNGTKVKQIPVSKLHYLDGIAGLRINHHLNVKVSDFHLSK
jgi:hypothetical protein